MMESNKKSQLKTVKRVSKSGRIIKTPKAILTTSSDEAPRQRLSKKHVNVRTELQRLREIANKSLRKKTSVSEHVSTAPESAMKESFRDASTENVAISTNIEQANLKETRTSSYESPLPAPECSGIQLAEPMKPTNAATLSSPANCHGISRPLPRNELPKTTVNIECGNEIVNLGETGEKVSNVDLKMILESLKKIVDQNQEIKLQFENIRNQNLEIIKQQKMILDGVEKQNIGEEVSTKLYEPLEGFPLKTIDEFLEIESDAKKSIRKKLYVHLCNLGGSRAREFLNCALKEVMTDELVNSFTWPGGKKSAKLGDTKVANILYLAAKKCPLFRGPDTKAEFKTDMLEVLRTTKQRFRNFSKKSHAAEQVDETDDELDDIDDEQLLRRIELMEERLNAGSENEDVHEEIDLSQEEDFDADYDTDDH